MGFKTFDGIIGNDILKRFNIAYDHINSKLYLTPNSLFDQDFRLDCSGMVLRYESDDDEILVGQVFENSSAEIVGVRVGDKLKAVNFSPAYNFDLVEIREMLMDPGGNVDLELERAGKIIQITIVLESLI